MKTSGIIRIYAISILSVFVFFIAGSASGQFSYTSQKKISFSVTDKRLATDGNFYTETKLISNENNNPLIPVSISFFEDTVNSKNIFFKPVINDSFQVTDVKKANSEHDEIAFRTTSFVYPVNSKADVGISEYSSQLLIIYAKALKEYAKKNDYDTCYAFLSNMGMLSNKKRFFVVNLVTMEIEQAGLVSHGRGKGATIYDKQYSDEPGSRCTSLGRYQILSKYKGKYGESYRMAGLDSSNINAYDRNIVLHSMTCVPDIENLMPACVSDGCPAVSGKFLSYLRQVIDSRKKPMLLWVFDSNLLQPAADENCVEYISADFFSITRKSFSINSTHANEQLHTLLVRPFQKNKFFKWLTEKQNRYYDPWKEEKN